jgi:hypothetical protein
VIRVTVEYKTSSRCWTHLFAVVALDQPKLQQMLQEAGFAELALLDAGKRWERVPLNAEN